MCTHVFVLDGVLWLLLLTWLVHLWASIAATMFKAAPPSVGVTATVAASRDQYSSPRNVAAATPATL